MRTIIAGSREETLYTDVAEAMNRCGWKPTVVLSGCARGVDIYGELWARRHSIPVEQYPAVWRTEDGRTDRSAGYKRNVLMAKKAEALVAVWNGVSNGTEHMIQTARSIGLRVYVHRV